MRAVCHTRCHALLSAGCQDSVTPQRVGLQPQTAALWDSYHLDGDLSNRVDTPFATDTAVVAVE